MTRQITKSYWACVSIYYLLLFKHNSLPSFRQKSLRLSFEDTKREQDDSADYQIFAIFTMQGINFQPSITNTLVTRRLKKMTTFCILALLIRLRKKKNKWVSEITSTTLKHSNIITATSTTDICSCVLSLISYARGTFFSLVKMSLMAWQYIPYYM